METSLILLLLGMLLGAWFSWLTVKRPNRHWLVARLLALWAIVACLVLLAFPPKLTRHISTTEAILLTPGYHKDTLRALQERQPTLQAVYSYGLSADGVTPLTDLPTFKQRHPELQVFHVIGHGLPAEHLPSLSDFHVVPHLSPLPTGLLSASWPKEITVGDELQIQGTFIAGGKNQKLYLIAAGRKRDSVIFAKPGRQPFQVTFRPKTSGNFVYALQWAKDSTQQESIPVTVLPPRSLAVLMLSSAPFFESKFLKNELARQGHQVAVRTQVGKGIYQTEFVNLPHLNLNNLNLALLQKFDAVFTDGETLKGLTGAELRVLRRAVQEQGLGVLTSFPENSLKPVPFFAEVVFKPFLEKQAKNRKLTWQNQENHSIEYSGTARFVQAQEGQMPLVWDTNTNLLLALQYRKGQGKVGVNLVTETFPWFLAGQNRLYQSFWANLFQSIVKPALKSAYVNTSSLTPANAGEMVEVLSNALFQSISADGSTPAKEQLQPAGLGSAPQHYSAPVWPTVHGWHSVWTGSDSVGSFYTHASLAWSLLRLQKQHDQMKSVAENQGSLPSSRMITIKEPMPLWPFALLMLLLSGFLWLEEKL